MRTTISGLVSLAANTAAADEAVITAHRSLVVSYNADAAFAGYLAAACGVARHRPQLLEPLLTPVIDAAVCMGVESIEAFWQYAEFCVRRDEAGQARFRDFGPDVLTFYRQNLRENETTIGDLLRTRLDDGVRGL